MLTYHACHTERRSVINAHSKSHAQGIKPLFLFLHHSFSGLVVIFFDIQKPV